MKPELKIAAAALFCMIAFCNCSKHVSRAVTSAETASSAPERGVKLNQGQKIRVNNVISATNSMEMMGQQMDIKIDINMMRQLDVTNKKDSSYLLNTTMKKIATSMEIMGQAMSYDSDKKDDSSEMAKAFKGKLDAPVEIEIDNNGKIIHINKDSTKPTSKEEDAISSMMSNINAGGDEVSSTEEVFLVLPKNIKPGDTWADSTVNPEDKITRHYTIISVETDSTRVSFTGQQTTNKTVEAQGMQMTVNIENKLSGEMVIDRKNGIVVRKLVTTEGSGTTDIMGQSVPMSTKSTMSTVVQQQ